MVRRYNKPQNIEERRIKALPRQVFRLAMGIAAFLVVAFALATLWLRHVALPNIDQYRDDIVASIEKASGMQVSARRLVGVWQGLRPRIALEGFSIADHQGRVALALERAEVSISWWTLLAGRLRFQDVEFYRPELHLRRGADGLIYLADKPLNEAGPGEGAFTEWLLAQPRLGIHEAVLYWRDDKANVPEVRLSRVEIGMRKHFGRHHAVLTAAPPRELARAIELRADVKLTREDTRWKANGEVYMDAHDADLAKLRAHLPVPETLRSGAGNARVWVAFATDGLREVVGDLNMRDATVQLASDALPLELASISGRASYTAQHGGFSLATEGLRFRLANGTEAQPGNFSITRTEAPKTVPRTEVRADGIDLKIAATLLDYFPVPRDLKAQVARYAPRGRITDAALGWSGDTPQAMTHYAVKGRFEELAINAVESLPGVTGVSGRIEGSERGGTVELDSKNATFALEQVFVAPIAFDRLQAHASWRHDGRVLEVTIPEAKFANADVEGTLAGTWRSTPERAQRGERSPGLIDVHANLTRALATRVANYVPNRIAQTRDYLQRSIQAGSSGRVSVELKGDLYAFPWADGSGHFLVEGEIRDGKLQYHPDWPPVDAIQGSLRFEGRRMEIRADRATIFASRASNVSAVIADLGAKPPVLEIQGDVDTTGADGVRFLRQSPLVNGPGAFTRAVSVEGPGKLRLAFQFPLWGPDRVARVQGKYTFNGATATAGRTLTMRDVKGELNFTEKGVRAPDIAGTLFGKPAHIAMGMTPEGQVLTTIEGKIDPAGVAPHVSEAIAARLSGSTDWKARVISGKQGTELTVTSDLKGVGSTLPEPLAKSADTALPLNVTVSRLGADDEVTNASLGTATFARIARPAPGSDRYSVAFKFGAPFAQEPVREGIWLYGSLANGDVDAWLAVFRPAADAAAVPRTEARTELRGIDLKVASARFWGRQFQDMRAQLTRDGGEWAGKLEGPRVAGDVRWSPAGKGRVQARLERLAVGEATGATPDVQQSLQQPDLPALDIVAERFDFRGKWLGKLELNADNEGDEWRIARLDITNGHAKFASHGVWRRTATGPITTLALKLETENLNALMGQFGYADSIKGGNGSLEGNLVWPGYPYDFAVANLAGSFKVLARHGQFAKIDPGAGKLLGLLSLQSLPRRATFDFRDVFSAGFAFERISADVKIARGILLTDNFEISGPAAFVSLKGEVSMPKETQTVTVQVVPEVGEAAAIAATIVGTPVLGLSTLLVTKLLKNPIGNAVAFEYQVTGSWDNPHVQRTSAAPLRATPAGSEGAAKASVP
jgi:uncharacterized protein (TIGR02099 family)